MVPRLIVNADDFGQTSGINRAVLELHQAGLLTSASIMARASATGEAIEMARATPTLGTGCHIVLTDGAPILRPDQVPSLLDRSAESSFIPSLTAFLSRLITGRLSAAEIEAEATAQIRYLQSRGIRVDHIDTHKHTHMFPQVLRPILRAARVCGVRTVRNPFEPQWAVRATAGASFVRTTQVNLLRRFQPAWHGILAAEGFATTDGTLGVTATGVLNAANLHLILQQVPAGSWELVTHPGYNDAELAGIPTALRASRDIERQALHRVSEFPALDLISFSQLTRQ